MRLSTSVRYRPGFLYGHFIHSDKKYTQSFTLIRYVRQNGNDMEFSITLQSDARKEYDELIKKSTFLFETIKIKDKTACDLAVLMDWLWQK
ncbi:hypothetical protein [Campylobacter californiensis]|uniref:hypothetical protein n=1 Tax=Campylobacter californiensis TaxID=1032243 RepID=UPI001D1416E0|nr:hypothetical protein [Campylobacter sp. RM13119]